MTLTIELSPERERALQAVANHQGVALPQLVDSLLDEALQDFEQDLEDATEVRQRLAETNIDECPTLDDLRKAWNK